MEQVALPVALAEARAALPAARMRLGRSTRAAAAYDEDVVTLAAAAAQQVLDARPAPVPAALVLATVTPPLAEGGTAPLLAEVLGLGPRLVVQEHGGTVACGGGALVAAASLVHAGIAPVLYVAGDLRRDPQGRPYGDAAVAAVLDAVGSEDDGVGRLEWRGSTTELFRDTWRAEGDERVTEADRSLLAHRPEAQAAAPRGTDEWRAVAVHATGPALERAGALGAPGLLVGILDALGTGRPRTVVDAAVSAGGVTHAFTVTAGAGAARAAQALQAALAGGRDGPPPAEPSDDGFEPYTSQPRAWRERPVELRLEGRRDPTTNEVLFPPPPRSAATRDLEPFRLSRRGHVYTATRDHVFPYGAPLTMAVVELEGGGRFYGQVADGLDVEIGQPVDLVLRRLHSGGGVPQYYWKVVPSEGPVAATPPERS